MTNQLKPTSSEFCEFIVVTGADSATFLQGQLTCDINALGKDAHQFAAYCSSQGRVLAAFRIFSDKDRYILCLPASNADATLKALQKYAVFSNVTLTHYPQSSFPDAIADDWRLTDIQAGIAHIFPATQNLFTPQMLNYDQIPGAISFDKGCYVGQEVIARTHYRGKVKRHLYRAQLSATTPPKPGETINNEQGESVGTLIDAYPLDDQIILLAVVQDSALDQPLFCQNKSLKN